MSEHPSPRDILIVDSAVSAQHERFNRWAIIVGISKYQTASLNLKYADRDAEKLYQMLLTPQGGHFQEEFICKLTNKTATRSNINRALRAFLKKPAKEDLVLIYFACHGAPDPERPSNVYLLTYDSDPKDIAGTALPVNDINRALKDTLHSEKVIILADTCHSAAIGGGIRSRKLDESTALINRYLKEVSTARGGTALLTSAEANEVSFEDAKWGGGHGVFTYYLLRGLKGAADTNKNGFVTVGELFEYVRENVKTATQHRQHPSIGTNPFDRNLPLAITCQSPAQQSTNSITSSSLLLSSPKAVHPLINSRFVGLFVATILAGATGFALLWRLGPLIAGLADNSSVTDSSGLATIDETRVRANFEEAVRIENATIAQLDLDKEERTEENLNEAVENWIEAIRLMKKVINVNQDYPQAIQKLDAYQNQLRYVQALRLGSRAAKLTKDGKDNTLSVEQWSNIEDLWRKAIETFREIPPEDRIYDSIQGKIT